MPHIRKKDLIALWNGYDAVEDAVSGLLLAPASERGVAEDVASRVASVQERLVSVRALLPPRPRKASSIEGSDETGARKTGKKSRKAKKKAAADGSGVTTGRNKRVKADRL